MTGLPLGSSRPPSDPASPWPLSAASTAALLGADGPSGATPVHRAAPVRLAIKQLMLHGLYTVTIDRRRFRQPRALVFPTAIRPGELPDPCSALHGALRPWTPGVLHTALSQEVAIKSNNDTYDDLIRRGLLVPTSRGLWGGIWPVRTTDGEHYASLARETADRASDELPGLVEREPHRAVELIESLGGLVLLLSGVTAFLSDSAETLLAAAARHQVGQPGLLQFLTFVTEVDPQEVFTAVDTATAVVLPREYGGVSDGSGTGPGWWAVGGDGGGGCGGGGCGGGGGS